MAPANGKIISTKYFYSCRNTPLDLHQSISFSSKKNKWNNVGMGYLLLVWLDRRQCLPVGDPSRWLFWVLRCLGSAKKPVWPGCNGGWRGVGQGNWTLWIQFCKRSSYLLNLDGLFEQCSSATFHSQLRVWVFLFLSESHPLFSILIISFVIKSCKIQP